MISSFIKSNFNRYEGEGRIKCVLLFLFLILFLIGCTSSKPRFTSSDLIEKRIITQSENENSSQYSNLNTVLESVTGTASYYAHKFHKRQTANGETFNMYDYTAAHPTYPFGTIIKVTNLSNQKSVKIRINDRMPQHPDRIIDLSYQTAIDLDMVEDGLANVRLDILKWGEE